MLGFLIFQSVSGVVIDQRKLPLMNTKTDLHTYLQCLQMTFDKVRSMLFKSVEVKPSL